MFDYFAGTMKRPPEWIERAGLHWAYRLAQEPRRLWRRNLDSPLFLARVLAERLGLVSAGIHPPSTSQRKDG
jgi:UDP-N-acetyl-D-mannosaminuronic acid transferase (WecB/TagA/CpsF family)